MKNNTITALQNWRLLSVALGGVLLLAGAGCNRITISVGGTPAMGHGASQAGPPAGGNFVPVQAALATSGSTTVCGQPVSGTYVRFYPPTQTPPAGFGGFQGYLRNVTTGAIIPNSGYYLQWFVNVANNGCCTPALGAPTTEVSCHVTPGLAYRFTAHFKTGAIPPPGTTVQLVGAWTLSEIDE